MLKAIFFDAAGTLIYLPRSVGEHYREVAARFGATLDADTLNHAFKKAWASAPARCSSGGPRLDDDKGWWRDLVTNVLTQVLTPEAAQVFRMADYFEAVYAHFTLPGVWEAYADVRPTLETLRARGLRFGLISNFDRRLYTILDHLSLREFFDAIVISSEVGADKPDPAIFQAALARLDVSAAEAIHVGDDPEKDWGAEASGLRIFRLERPSHTLHDLLAALPPYEAPS